MTMQEKFAEKIKNVCEKYRDKTFITYMKEDDSEENWTYKDFWKQTNERVLAYKNSPILECDNKSLEKFYEITPVY